MCLFVFVYVFACVCLCLFVFSLFCLLFVCVFVLFVVCASVFVCMFVCMFVCLYVCLFLSFFFVLILFNPKNCFVQTCHVCFQNVWGEQRTFSSRTKQLTVDSINSDLVKAEYAVRGAVVQRAMEIEQELRSYKCSADVHILVL